MTDNAKYWYLHHHKLFKNLSFTEIDALCILKRFKKTKRSEIVELPFSSEERIFFLKKGTLKLLKINEAGEEVLIDVIQKGDIFGELDLQTPATASEFMKVVSDEAIICTFFRSKLEELMLKKPEFALNYIKYVGFNFKKVQNDYRNLFFKDAKTRLILFFTSLIEKEEVKKDVFELPGYLTQKDIAQLICTSRQTVISLMDEIQREGIILPSNANKIQLDVKKVAEYVK